MSGNVDSAITRSGMVENVGLAVRIALPSVSVQKLFLLPVYSSPFCVIDVGRCRAMLAVSNPCRAW